MKKYKFKLWRKRDKKSKFNISKNAAPEDIKYQGNVFSNKYVLTRYKGDENLYDDISNFLKSVQKHEIEITIQKKTHPKWHINQILSLFEFKYPARIAKKSDSNVQQRRIFRKEVSKYKLDKNNRLTILNPPNKEEENEIPYKIPFLHEKEILIKHAHFSNNHCGRQTVINYLHQKKMVLDWMNNDIANIIKLCTQCNQPFKFKSLSKKTIIILDKGPHYRCM